MKYFPSLCLVGALILVGGGHLLAEIPRFSAMLAGGQRMDGKKLTDWHKADGRPRLDGKEILNPGNPLIWLRDRKLHPGRLPRAYVELAGGDRLPGTVVGYVSPDAMSYSAVSDHFLVEPLAELSPPGRTPHAHVRVVRDHVRRIVWRRRGATPLQPGTLIFADGRSMRFRVARFRGDQVQLLTSDGQQRVAMSEIGELHLPAVDPWDDYFDQLAKLHLGQQARLLQLDTTTGLTVTGTLERFDALSHGSAGDSDNWWHAVQPAWCLDMLWVPGSEIWMRRCFLPHEVPLSRFLPSHSQSDGSVTRSRRAWQANVSTRGRPLESGGQSHGWGLGVHAFSQLEFALPEQAVAFRTRLGLDRAARNGGCVRARVFAGSAGGPRLYESPHIVGSSNVLDTGDLSLANLPKENRTLVLQVDAAHQGRPSGADPLDIRDVFDWLDPVVKLDPAKLQEEIHRRTAGALPAFADWQPVFHPQGKYTWQNDYEQFLNPQPGRFVPTVRIEGQPMMLRRTLQVGERDNWLVISAYRRGASHGEPEIEIRIDGLPAADYVIPQRGARALPDPLVVSLAPFRGRRINIEVIQQPSPNTSMPPVHWHLAGIAEHLPTLNRLFDDQGKFARLGGEGEVRLLGEDHRAGARCAEMTKPGQYRIRLDQPLRVRSSPDWGEVRYLRFAFRKFGKGTLRLHLQHAEDRDKPAIYTAGVPLAKNEDKPADDGKPKKGEGQNDEQTEIRPPINIMGQELASDWVVIDRDVFADFGEFDVVELVVEIPDGESARLDEVYAANQTKDFQQIPAAPTVAEQSPENRQGLLQRMREIGHAATLAVHLDGRMATGVLVSNQRHLLTAGHFLVAPGRDLEVELPDGRRLPAKSLGIDRTLDVGLVQIAETKDVALNGPALSEAKDYTPLELYVAYTWPQEKEEAAGAMLDTVALKAPLRDMFWTNHQRDAATIGGPLMERGGRIIGIHVANSPAGGSLYIKSHLIRQSWDRLARGEMWGQWLPGSEPMLGLDLGAAKRRLTVNRLADDSPARQAGVQAGDVLQSIEGQAVENQQDIARMLSAKDPSHDVTLDLLRGEQKLQVKVKLLPRVP